MGRSSHVYAAGALAILLAAGGTRPAVAQHGHTYGPARPSPQAPGRYAPAPGASWPYATAAPGGASGQAAAAPGGMAAGMAGQTPQAPYPSTTEPGAPPAEPGVTPGAEGAPTTPTPTAPPSLTPSPTDGAGLEGLNLPTAPSAGLGEAIGQAGGFFPNVIGDQGPFLQHRPFRIAQTAQVPPIPEPGRPPVPPTPNQPVEGGQALFPSARGFKIAENQSPRPVDRFYFTFNFFDGVNTSINRSLGIPLSNIKAYREIFGFEKTFLDGRASAQLRLPLNQINAQGPFVDLGFGGFSSSAGDLGVVLKYALYDDPRTGRFLSTGLLVNTPTGPTNFGGARYLRSVHVATLQPFIGYILPYGRFYLQGFSSIDVPVDSSDVTILYNDLSMGYFLYQTDEPGRLLRAFVPTFEAHINTPLNHRDYLNPFDPVGTPDVVNLTFAGNAFLGRRSLLTVGLVEPVTGPRPFNYEFLIQFNLFF